ncbi:hypothetical protein ACFVYP_40980 [Kitasatospora sp. NPDC058201]|uniref:hypothetical protein n=1 Tax=unclassified Kitasatospora TaxID=2633591 RepID=UPI0036655858
MVDRRLCNTSRHLVTKIDAWKEGPRSISFFAILRETLWGILIMSALATVLVLTVSPMVGASVFGVSAVGLVVAFVFFKAAGHLGSCSVKKAVFACFGWWEMVW